MGRAKSLRNFVASERPWVIRCLPSGILPVIAIPIPWSMLKIRRLVRSTRSFERTCFYAPRTTPSLHLTPTMVLNEETNTLRFRQPWQRTQAGEAFLLGCRWCSPDQIAFKYFLKLDIVCQTIINSRHKYQSHEKSPSNWIFQGAIYFSCGPRTDCISFLLSFFWWTNCL